MSPSVDHLSLPQPSLQPGPPGSDGAGDRPSGIQQTLTAAEERLQQQTALLQLALDAIVVWNRERRITFWNRGAEETYGYSAAEALGSNMSELLATQFPAPIEQINAAVESGGRWQGELVHRRKDGSRIVVESRWGMLRDSAGAIVGTIEVCRDVSAKRAAEQALRTSEDRFRTMADAAPVMIWVSGPDKKCMYFNRGWLEFTGRTMEQEVGDGWTESVHRDDLARAMETYHSHFDRRRPFTMEYRFRRVDGVYRWVLNRGLPLLAAEGTFQGFIGSAIDITERKHTETSLREAADYLGEQRRWLESVLDLLPVPMLLIDPAGNKVTFSNRAARSAAGAFDPRATSRLEFFCDAQGSRLAPDEAPVARVSRGDRLRGFEMQWRRPDGTRSLIVNAESLPPMHSHERVAVLVYQDITKQKQVEAELRRANQAKDALLAMLGHELRNPLAAITGAGELLELLEPADPTFAQARQILNTHIQHLVRLVDDMLDVSRLTSGKIRIRREPLDLRDVVRDSIRMCDSAIEARRHTLTVRMHDQPLPVEGDAARLEQVFVNLLMNAAKYTDEGGEIQVITELADHRAVVRIRDNGIGIRPDLLPQVFDLFRQLNPSLHRAEGGLGIGLNVVKNLVELHGGTVAAFSEGPDRGSEFVVQLPQSTAPSATVRELPPARSAGSLRGPLKVLVVEDNPDIAHTMVALIRHLGHAVKLADSGQAALDVAVEFIPDVAFLDIGLPGMSGLELAQSFRANHRLREVFLIALTGFGQADDRRRSMEAGFQEHLVKPLNFARLQEILATVPKK